MRMLLKRTLCWGTLALCLLILVAVPLTGYAQNPPTGGSDGGTGGGGQGTGVSFSLINPLKVDSLQCLLYVIIEGLIPIIAIVAAIYIIWSGFMFITAQGNPEKIKAARKSFVNALIGTAILLGAWAITSFIVNVINTTVLKDRLPSLPTSSSCNTTP